MVRPTTLLQLNKSPMQRQHVRALQPQERRLLPRNQPQDGPNLLPQRRLPPL